LFSTTTLAVIDEPAGMTWAGRASDVESPLGSAVVLIDGVFAVAAFAMAGAGAMTTITNIAVPIVRRIMFLSRFSSFSMSPRIRARPHCP
jgi:hypothetical protein